VRTLGVPYAIVRPTLVVGQHDILVNNIAWFLRRFPLFTMPSSGAYRLQPVTLEDVGEIIADAALSTEDATVDAAGPEIFTFEQFVNAIARAIGRERPVVHLPVALSLQLIRLVGFAAGEVILSKEELAGLTNELLLSHEPPLGRQSVLDWLNEHGSELGTTYTSELRRHTAFRPTRQHGSRPQSAL
jgi:NADH dehydrogenase